MGTGSGAVLLCSVEQTSPTAVAGAGNGSTLVGKTLMAAGTAGTRPAQGHCTLRSHRTPPRAGGSSCPAPQSARRRCRTAVPHMRDEKYNHEQVRCCCPLWTRFPPTNEQR